MCAAWPTRSSSTATEPVRGLSSPHRNDKLLEPPCRQNRERRQNRTPGVRNEDEDTKDTDDAFRCCPSADSALYSRRQRPERTRQTGDRGQTRRNRTAVEEDCDSSAACVQTSAAAAHRALERTGYLPA